MEMYLRSRLLQVKPISFDGDVIHADVAVGARPHSGDAAMLEVMASAEPMTATAMKEAAKAHLPDDLFPGGATSGWWQKCVQLDLEAKGVIERHATKPLTFSLK